MTLSIATSNFSSILSVRFTARGTIGHEGKRWQALSLSEPRCRKKQVIAATEREAWLIRQHLVCEMLPESTSSCFSCSAGGGTGAQRRAASCGSRSAKIAAQHQSRLQQALSARVTPAKQRCSSRQVLPRLLQALLKKLLAYRMNHAVKHSSYKNVKLLYGAKMTTNNKGVFVCLCLLVRGRGFL